MNVTIQCIAGCNICVITVTATSFFMGIGLYIRAFCYQFESTINKANNLTETSRCNSQLECILKRIVILQIKIREYVLATTTSVSVAQPIKL